MAQKAARLQVQRREVFLPTPAVQVPPTQPASHPIEQSTTHSINAKITAAHITLREPIKLHFSILM